MPSEKGSSAMALDILAGSSSGGSSTPSPGSTAAPEGPDPMQELQMARNHLADLVGTLPGGAAKSAQRAVDELDKNALNIKTETGVQ